jgi:dihydrodipicolinate synthase/N-acetylneuraminate lyase
MTLNLNGIIAALPTPFDHEGNVDHAKLKSNLEYWNQTDLSGYLILGSTGEFPHLTTEEKLALIETVRGAMATEKLLLVGTGELSTRQTIEMSKRTNSERTVPSSSLPSITRKCWKTSIAKRITSASPTTRPCRW